MEVIKVDSEVLRKSRGGWGETVVRLDLVDGDKLTRVFVSVHAPTGHPVQVSTSLVGADGEYRSARLGVILSKSLEVAEVTG